MFATTTPTQELLELRAQALNLVVTPGVTDSQYRNLCIMLEMIDAELCSRCKDECIVPDPRPAFCKNVLLHAG